MKAFAIVNLIIERITHFNSVVWSLILLKTFWSEKNSKMADAKNIWILKSRSIFFWFQNQKIPFFLNLNQKVIMELLLSFSHIQMRSHWTHLVLLSYTKSPNIELMEVKFVKKGKTKEKPKNTHPQYAKALNRSNINKKNVQHFTHYCQ